MRAKFRAIDKLYKKNDYKKAYFQIPFMSQKGSAPNRTQHD